MNSSFDRNKTLEQLENFDWGEPEPDSSFDPNCYHLRRKPLNELTLEELKVFIDRGIGLLYLIPLALEQLELNPLAEARYFAGDLLVSVLSIDVCFWASFREPWLAVEKIIDRIQTIDQTSYEQILPLAVSVKQAIG